MKGGGGAMQAGRLQRVVVMVAMAAGLLGWLQRRECRHAARVAEQAETAHIVGACWGTARRHIGDLTE